MDYVKYIEIIKELKRQGKHNEAVEILLKCVKATEDEDKQNGWGVAPWYYEQLAIIYKKEGDRDKEIEILRRYQKQRKAPGTMPEKLMQRLEKILNS